MNLKKGDRLIGYCNGYFGRFYLNKIVDGVGADWIVARETDGPLLLADLTEISETQRNELVSEWKAS